MSKLKRRPRGKRATAPRPSQCERLETRRLLTYISGTLNNDANDNGTLDWDEGGLSGWTVYVDSDEDSQLDAGEPSTTSDGNGWYILNDLPTWTCHLVRAQAPWGWRLTNPTDYNAVYLTEEGYDGANFLATERGMISGVVYDDEDADAERNIEEFGIADRTVFLDADENGVFDFGEEYRVTDGGGRYAFNNRDTNTTYVVRLVGRVGWVIEQKISGDTYSDHHRRYLSNGEAYDGSFGERPELSTPRDLAAEWDADETTVHFNWSHTSLFETDFRLERSTDDGETWHTVGDPIGPDLASYSLANQSKTGGFNGASPQYRLVAVNASNGTQSRPSLMTNPSAQPRPQNVQAFGRWDTTQSPPRWTVTLTWDHPPGFENASYNIYRSFVQGRVPRGPYAIGVTGTTWTDPDPNLQPGQKIYYTVVCVFGGNYSINGGEVQTTIPTQTNQYSVSKFFYQGNLANANWGEGPFVLPDTSPLVGPMTVDVPAFDTTISGGMPYKSASAHIDWIMHYDWETDAGEFTASASIAYSNEDQGHTSPSYYAGHGKTNQPDSIVVGGEFKIRGTEPVSVDSSPANPGVNNDIEVWSQLAASASWHYSGGPSSHTSITGRYSGYYTVTYEWGP